MRRAIPGLLLGVVLVGCGGVNSTEKPIDPSLNTATFEVKGMT